MESGMISEQMVAALRQTEWIERERAIEWLAAIIAPAMPVIGWNTPDQKEHE